MTPLIELEDMSEEQVGKLCAHLRSAISDQETERNWRESEDDGELLPLLRGLCRYLGREYLDEDEVFPLDETLLEYDEEEDDLDF